jgi:hypothetical protein
MTIPRALILAKGENVYHCISRCVRRAYLCGQDLQTGKNFDHRKGWVQDRLILLSKIFAIDVLGYALMSTHSHSMLRTRPDLLKILKDEEVVRRWLKLYPKKKCPAGSKLFEELVKLTVSDEKRVAVLRKRLGSISWFMKSLNEYIARKSNKEDECKGRFWEGRFKCQRLCDQAAQLSCAVYIDLNPIRAEIAKTPETSEYTSAYERIKSLKLKNSKKNQYEPALWLSPIQDTRDRRGFLSLSLPEYLTILDISGRELSQGKRGKIPENLSPILERLSIKPEYWLQTCQSCSKWFSSAMGSSESLRSLASDLGRAWLKGVNMAQRAFV